MSDGIQAISRAAELLSIVVRAEDPMTYTSLVDRTGLARSTASRVLQALERGDDTGETVNLAVARGRSVTHRAQIDTPHLVGAMNWIDIEVPPHCSALGKAMYTFGALPFPEGRLERRTEHTITRLNTLE